MPPRVLARIFQPVPPKSHPSCASPHSSEAASRKSRRFRAVFGGQGVLVRHTSTRGTQSTRAGKRETQRWRAATHPHGVRRRAREGMRRGPTLLPGIACEDVFGNVFATSSLHPRDPQCTRIEKGERGVGERKRTPARRKTQSAGREAAGDPRNQRIACKEVSGRVVATCTLIYSARMLLKTQSSVPGFDPKS